MIDDLNDEKLALLNQLRAKEITTVIVCGAEDGISFSSNVNREEAIALLEFMISRLHAGHGVTEEVTTNQ